MRRDRLAFIGAPSEFMEDKTFEKHYSIAELAKIWRLNRETVRQIVMHEPDVVRVRRGLLGKRTKYSVPESVARRIHNKLDDRCDANDPKNCKN
jgi:hypothetical protein